MHTPLLFPRTPSSFFGNHLDALITHLLLRGWHRRTTAAPCEIARLGTDDGALLVFYSHTLVVQGQHRERTLATLTSWVVVPVSEQPELPL
jgi:hypothetical protein